MRISIPIIIITIVILCSSFNGEFQGESSKLEYRDTSIAVLIVAKFVRQTFAPCCCFFYIKERNMFETVVSFKNKQLVKKIIEIEYSGNCTGHSFIVGKLYNITARKNALRNCYESITTFPVKEIADSL